MKRFLVDPGVTIGNDLASTGAFAARLSPDRAERDLPICDELVIVGAGVADCTCENVLRPLIDVVAARAKRLVLLSSLDVYPMRGLPFDETYADIRAPETALRRLERAVLEKGGRNTVLRLPDVFGPSITDGAAGALLDRDASRINRVAIHQWYPLRRLKRDMAAAARLDAGIVNLCTEPLPMTAVLAEFFPGQFGQVKTPAPYSRIRTRYAEAFGGGDGYVMGADEVLAEMRRFVLSHRQPRGGKTPSRAARNVDAASGRLASAAR